jgi:hypothetical protein
MKDEVLDALAHGVIESLGRKEIDERRSRRLLSSNNINLNELRELLPKEPKPFDIAEVRDETHLREIIMNRVLETAAHNITISVMDGPPTPLADLPEDHRAEHLNKIMMEFLDSNSGPGPVLRQYIASTILNYRMRNRLEELLPTLPLSSSKSKRVEQGIAHIEKRIETGMFYFEAWTFFSDEVMGKPSNMTTQKLIELLLERETKD